MVSRFIRANRWWARGLITLILAAALLAPLWPQNALAVSATAAPVKNGATHYVQRGDSLSAIAVRYGVSMQAIMAANGLANPNHIYVGQRLIIPDGYGHGGYEHGGYGQDGYGKHQGGYGGCANYHYVQYGQTLSAIAAYYGVSAYALAQTNGIYNLNYVYTGQRLCIPGGYAPVPQPNPPYPHPQPGDCGATYTVRRGDTLSWIAHRCGVTVQSLIYANGLPNANHIYVGQQLVITGGAPQPPVPTPVPPVPSTAWDGAYYNNSTLSGAPTYTRQDGAIDFRWNDAGPGGGLANDGFSIRWTPRPTLAPAPIAF
ncbi:MAG: LysM peptidoglycan-binding domain-containing protein [Caldilineaceae bacterium]